MGPGPRLRHCPLDPAAHPRSSHGGEGSLYPALHRLEERGWIQSEWQRSDTNRRAKFYTLTARGRLQLRAETASWGRFVDAVANVLNATGQPA